MSRGETVWSDYRKRTDLFTSSAPSNLTRRERLVNNRVNGAGDSTLYNHLRLSDF